MIYKTLSLWQPWASLIIWGEKMYETRDWTTPHRGLLAIHASSHKPNFNDVAHMKELFFNVCRKHQAQDAFGLDKLPLGAVLGICELKAIYHTEQMVSHLSSQERAFGNYAPGRAAWELKVIHVFDKPFLATGKRSIWNWEGPKVKAS